MASKGPRALGNIAKQEIDEAEHYLLAAQRELEDLTKPGAMEFIERRFIGAQALLRIANALYRINRARNLGSTSVKGE